MMLAPYGYCPTCKSPGKTRERRPNGNDTCENGHTYPNKSAMTLVEVMENLTNDDPPAGNPGGWLSEEKIREHIDGSGTLLNNEQVKVLLDENDQLRKLIPPEPERGPGFVDQEAWSFFAEKVVEERDEAREELLFLMKKNKDLEAKLKELGEQLAAKKEKANINYSLAEFIGIEGYGAFSLKKLCKDRWEIRLHNEKVVLYNKKGHRVRGDLDNSNPNYDGDW